MTYREQHSTPPWNDCNRHNNKSFKTDEQIEEVSKNESSVKDLSCCPFCGGEIFIWPAMIRTGYRVSCENDCFAMPARPDVAFSSREKAADACNRRA